MNDDKQIDVSDLEKCANDLWEKWGEGYWSDWLEVNDPEGFALLNEQAESS